MIENNYRNNNSENRATLRWPTHEGCLFKPPDDLYTIHIHGVQLFLDFNENSIERKNGTKGEEKS